MIVREGRVLGPAAYRPGVFRDLEDTVEWWSALATFGGLTLGAGLLAGAGEGDPLALGGVALFFLTAVLAGAERIEFATGVGTAALVWTATGIGIGLGTDPSFLGSLVALGAVGAAALCVGVRGAVRADGRTKRISASAPVAP